MANFNKVILIGRLTRDPESRTFSNGGKVVKFGFAVSGRKKNQQTGQFEDDPMFIDCTAFNGSGNYRPADIIEQYCRKGSQICLEGKLKLDRWDDKTTGQKRSKHEIIVDNIQLLDRREDGGGGDGFNRGGSVSAPGRGAPMSADGSYDDQPVDEPSNGGGSGAPEEVPF